MSWELSTNSNYTYFTNTVDSSNSLRYPTKDILYRESPNAIDIIFKFDRATMITMQKSDIVLPVFDTNQELIDWLDDNTGAIDGILNLDAFGRLRTSGTGQRFDAEFIYDKQPTLFDEVVVGAGTVIHNPLSRDLSLKVNSTTTGDAASIIQHWHNPYTAGNSQLIDMTGTLNASNITGATTEIFLKSGIDSSEDIYLQNDWNINTVPSVDWSKSQIFQMDFQSLKVGTIKFNILRNGKGVTVHEINNDNRKVGGYWQYPALPLQWRIYNTATETITEIGYFDDTNGIGFRTRVPKDLTAEIRAICCTVKSEGGADLEDLPGLQRSVDMGVTPKTVSTTLVPILSIRVKSLFNTLDNKGLYVPQSFGIQTDNPILYRVIVGGVLTGAVWTDVGVTSGIEKDLSATTITGGTEIVSDYISSGMNTDSSEKGLLGKEVLSKGYVASDILTIAAIRTSTLNASVLASINWKEIR